MIVADAPPPPEVDTVVVMAPRLPPSPSDRAFAVVRVEPDAIATAPRVDEALTQVPGVQLFRRTSSAAANPTVLTPGGPGRTDSARLPVSRCRGGA